MNDATWERFGLGVEYKVNDPVTHEAPDSKQIAYAEEMLTPTRVMPGVTVAIVRAPGGVPIGLSGP